MALTTLDKVKEYLEIAEDDMSRDSVLTRLIPTASSAIEQYCRRKFNAADYEESYPGPKKMLFPRQYPIISIASLTDDDEAIEDYKNRESYIDLGATYSGEIEISYRAGYETIPDDLEQACIMLIDFYYKTDLASYSRVFADTGSVISRPVAMPGHVKVLLETYKKVLV